MEINSIFYIHLYVLGTTILAHGFPSLTPDPSLQDFTFTQENNNSCQKVSLSQCSGLYVTTQLPNVYGHYKQEDVNLAMSVFFQKGISPLFSLVNKFLCVLYLPPCSDDIGDRQHKRIQLPCRSLCEAALSETSNNGNNWPVECHLLPTENCYYSEGSGLVRFMTQNILKPKPSQSVHQEDIASFAPLDIELGNTDGFELEVVSMPSSQIPVRRYDIADLGDAGHFRGWADVQGTGHANDYCRVIGKSKRKFLSCNLAGSTGQGHHYVSKLGFDVGFDNTWFMRDMDGDGRDDYCRCTGTKSNSKVTCMKAGEKGFYGSTTQGGNQYTYTLQHSGNCHNKQVNPWFGE